MQGIARTLELAGSCILDVGAVSAVFALETYQAQSEASDAASQARIDMAEAFGGRVLRPGQYVWRNLPDVAGPQRVIISLSDQLAYLYRGSTLVEIGRAHV